MPKPAMWDALTENEQELVTVLRSGADTGTWKRRDWKSCTDAAQQAYGNILFSLNNPGKDALDACRFAAERLLRLCEIAQEMEAGQ